jgi:hypothetical protein
MGRLLMISLAWTLAAALLFADAGLDGNLCRPKIMTARLYWPSRPYRPQASHLELNFITL